MEELPERLRCRSRPCSPGLFEQNVMFLLNVGAGGDSIDGDSSTVEELDGVLEGTENVWIADENRKARDLPPGF